MAKSVTNADAATFPTLATDQNEIGDAADLTGATIAGEDTLTVTALDKAAVNLSGLTANSVVAELEANGAIDADMKLGKADVQIDGSHNVTIAEGDDLCTATFVVVEGSALTLKAA